MNKIPYDYDVPCICAHKAADHWQSTTDGDLVSSYCRECCASNYYILEGFLVCLGYRQDNLAYLERELKKKSI